MQSKINIGVYSLSFLLLISCIEFTPQPSIQVPYGVDPETPSQKLLDSLAQLKMDALSNEMIDMAPGVQQRFYRLDGKPFTGWAQQNFKDSHNRTRYFKVDSGWVCWQIGYFDNGQPDCDFHALNGKNHGNQRMWTYNGTPYINTNSLNGKNHGIQRRWHSNGNLEWYAEYDHGQAIFEVFYNKQGKIARFSGEFEWPVPDENEFLSLKRVEQSSNGVIDAYLSHYFVPTSDKIPVKINGQDTCHYNQTYAENIHLKIDHCRSIANSVFLELPSIPVSNTKELMYILFKHGNEDDSFSWTSDTLHFTEDGLVNSMGCEFHFEKADSKTTVEIICTE